jgi:DNA-binding transcriptional MocR family regulator
VSLLPEANVISFARGIPSPDVFPIAQLAESARRAVEEDGRVALNYGPPGGFEPLREWVADRHDVDPGRVLLLPGSLIGLGLVVRHLLRDGGRAVVEAPTYDRILRTLGAAGAEVVAVDRGDDGIDLDRLREVAAGTPRPALLYALPTFHNPTGRTLTLEQREALADLALEHELLVVEDDAYGLLRVEGGTLPTVHELLCARGGDELAVHSSSFSKSVAPGLRVGYLLLPERLVEPIGALATQTYVSPPLLPQAQLHHFLAAGHLEPHLASLRGFLRERRDALLETLAQELPEDARWTRPEGGYFLWLELPGALDTAALLGRARSAGVAFVPGSGFFPDGRGRSTARLSFSYPSVDEIRVGARRLAALVRDELDRLTVRPRQREREP